MSQQEKPQDNQDNSSAPQADAWSTPPAANRPAEGASLGASIQSAEQTWSAGDDATDFLGLDQDAAGQPSAGAGAAEANPTQAWLFGMESGTAAAAAQQTARAPSQPSQLSPAPQWPAEAVPSSEEFSPEAEEILAAPEETESVAESDRVPYTGPRSRGKQLLVAASVAALLAVGGWQYWQSKTKTQSTGTNDPQVWRSTAKKTPKGKPAPTENPVAQTPSVAKVPPVGQPPASDPTATPTPVPTQPAEVAQAQPPSGEPQPVPPELQPTATAPTPDQPPAGDAAQPGSAPVEFTPVAFSGTRTDESGAELSTPRGTRRPAASEIAGLWTSRAIPFDAIGADSLMHTPSVGAVRVLLKNGEHLQGRLHSVGRGYVSMDIALGRMSVDYSEVREIVQILDADLNKKPSNGLPEETAGLLYVTAKVPGGYLTGWLVQRAEGKLTLITEQAKKVTIEDDGFEPISKNRARLVGALKSSATEAASPAPPPDTSTPKLQRGPSPTKAPTKQDRPKPKG